MHIFLLLVPNWRSRRGLLVYLLSVCLSFCFQISGLFSAVDEYIQLKFDIWVDYISMNYRLSLSFFMVDQLLTELFPLMFTFSFPDFKGFFFFLPWMKWGIWKFLYGFLFNRLIYQVRILVHLTFFDWIMALYKLGHSVVWLKTRKLFGLESSNFVFWCILTSDGISGNFHNRLSDIFGSV
jgi:hypothetical protein